MHRGPGLGDFAHEAARILARAVPFDGVCVLAMDPATLLPTNEVVENGLPPSAFARMAEIEMRGEDFNTFTALARSERPAASLSEATDGELERSLRHREVRREHGFGDELRAALAGDGATWGGLTLLRGSDCRHFEPGDADLVASLSRHLAEGLRRVTPVHVGGRARTKRRPGSSCSRPTTRSRSTNEAADEWLAELPGGPLPPAVTSVASRARCIADGTRARGRERPRAGADGVRALAAGARLDARRPRGRADRGDDRAARGRTSSRR